MNKTAMTTSSPDRENAPHMHAAWVAVIQPGARIAVLGSGPIGLLTAVAAHASGAETLLMTDPADRNLEVSRQLLPAETIDIRAAGASARLEALAGSFDAVFLTVGLASVVASALQLVRRAGRVISIALFEEPVPIDFNRLMIGEFTVRGSSMYVREDFQAAIDLIAAARYPLEPLITHRFDFAAIDAAMALAADRRDQPIKVMLDMTGKC
jgi:L-iditol 2-dehydrogenase